MQPKPKILIVDDKKENLISLEKILSELDVEFIRAYSGNEALTKVLDHNFALILMDIQMPDMDGFETVRLMQQDKKMRLVPVIFVTAINFSEKYQIKGISNGAIDFIIKPVIPEILIGKINSFLRLYKQKQYLLEKNIIFEKIIRTVSHDIRSPLLNIQGGVSELQKIFNEICVNTDKDDSNDVNKLGASEIIGYMEKSILKIESLLNSLIQLSLTGKENVAMDKIDMNFLIKNIILNFQFQIQERNIKFKIDELPACKADTTHVNQIFSNLIGNAIKYCSLEADKKIEISAEIVNNKAVYCVMDNGIGIAKDDQKVIFESFRQIDKSMAGDGLGLAIVNNLVVKNNGDIWVESELGAGSKFYVSLPAADSS